MNCKGFLALLSCYFGLMRDGLDASWDGWLAGCLRLNGPMRQYFSLYRAVSQREGERKERW